MSLTNTLNFSETARQLKIAQPAVSRQIKMMEEQLGIKLFIRDRHGVMLTEEGKRLKLNITPLLEGLNSALSQTVEQSESLAGTISFGCLAEVGQKVIVPAICKFKKKHPEIIFNIKLLKAYEIINQIKDGLLDFGIIPTPLEQESLRVYEVLKEESILVTREKYQKKIVDLKEESFVAYREDDPLLLSYLKKFHPRFLQSKISYSFTVNSQKSMIDTLLMHDSCAVMPRLSVMDELKRGVLREASPKKLNSSLYFVYYENHLMERRKQLFRDYLLKELKSVGGK